MIVPQAAPTESNIPVHTQFSIKANGKAFKLLSSNLYSDKPLAILREIGSNAYDAHKAAEMKGMVDQTKVPFKVVLPSELHPYLEITDYGIGLSDVDVREVYTVYFSSTKDQSNDYIGALGLGSKSPFSYADTFEVISRKDGVQNHYTCFLNADGAPEIYLLETKHGNFVNGVTVKVPVKQTDYRVFKEAARRAYRFFDVKPDIGAEKLWDPEEVHFEGTNFKVIKGLKGAWAKMGQVAYPLDLTKVKNSGFLTKYMGRYNHGFLIQVKIGDLDVNAGREGLSYDKTTIENIEKAIQNIGTEMAAELQKELDTIPKLYQALEWKGKNDPQDIFDLKRDGKPIGNTITYKCFKNGNLDKFLVKSTGYYKTKLASNSNDYVAVQPHNGSWFLLVDDRKSYVKKIRYSTDKMPVGKANIILSCIGDEKASFKDMIAEFDRDGTPYKFISDLTFDAPPKVGRLSSGDTPKYSGFYHHPGDFFNAVVTGDLDDLLEEEMDEDFIYIKWNVKSKRAYLNDEPVAGGDFTKEIWAMINKAVAKTGKPIAIVSDKCWDKIPKHWEDITVYLAEAMESVATLKTLGSVYGSWVATIASTHENSLVPIKAKIKSQALAKFIDKVKQIKINQNADYRTEQFFRGIFGEKEAPIAALKQFKTNVLSNPLLKWAESSSYGTWANHTFVASFGIIDALIQVGELDESVLHTILAEWK